MRAVSLKTVSEISCREAQPAIQQVASTAAHSTDRRARLAVEVVWNNIAVSCYSPDTQGRSLKSAEPEFLRKLPAPCDQSFKRSLKRRRIMHNVQRAVPRWIDIRHCRLYG